MLTTLLLSDGEHQLGQLLGMLAMLAAAGKIISSSTTESHVIREWRGGESYFADTWTANSERARRPGPWGGGAPLASGVSFREHSLSVCDVDMQREAGYLSSGKDKGKVRVRNPSIETLWHNVCTPIIEEGPGSTPMSGLPR